MSKMLNSCGMLVLLAALLGGATAADNAAMTLTGIVGESVEVTVSPSSFTWALSMGPNTYTAQDTTATIAANPRGPHTAALSVKETASGENIADGKMFSPTVHAALGDELALDATTAGANDIDPLSGTDKILYVLGSPGSQVVDFDYMQTISYSDEAASDYGIVVSFTGEILPGWPPD